MIKVTEIRKESIEMFVKFYKAIERNENKYIII